MTIRPASAPPGLPQALDSTGEETLELFCEHSAYNEFIWDSLSSLAPRAVSGRVLEVGCGIGNLTRLVLRAPEVTQLHSIDMDPVYVQKVAQQIQDERLCVSVARAEDFCPPRQGPGTGFDVIFSSNVLEHIEDDVRVLRNFRSWLGPSGLVLLLVPAHPFLYCGLDRGLSHFRRYSAGSLRERAGRAGLQVLKLKHFNPLGALGWWYAGKVLGRPELPPGQLSWYCRFAIGLSRLADRLNPFPFGVSLLAALAPDDS